MQIRYPIASLVSALLLLSACEGDGESSPVAPPSTPDPPRPTSITISPDSLVLGVDGDTARFTATVRDQNGNPMNGLAVTWTSSDTSSATVDSSGLVTSRRPGNALIRAAAQTLQSERKALVRLQLNARCTVPTGFPLRGGVGALPSFEGRPIAVQARYFIVDAAILDLEGDRDQDIILFENSIPERGKPLEGRTTVWRNQGDGRFDDVTPAALGGATVRADIPRDIEVSDLNGDGRPDVFVAQHGFDDGRPPFPGAPNLLLIQQAGGSLRESASGALNPYERDGFTHATAAADVDCDGDTDLFEGNFAISETAPPAHLQINSGAGTFQAQDDRLPDEVAGRKSLPGQFTGGRALISAAEFCDVDRDGDQDLVLGMQGVRDILLLNDGFGRFRFSDSGALPEARFGDATHASVEIKCADFDRDGWPDLVVSSTDAASESQFYSRPDLALWRNNGNGTFSDGSSTQLPHSFSRRWIRRVAVADVNQDDWPDIIASDNPEEYPRIFVNQGGRFVERVLAPATGVDLRGAPLFPLGADGDGRTDLYAARRTEQHYVLYSR